jgi:cytochrome bd-type quinol oxidase subunit 2
MSLQMAEQKRTTGELKDTDSELDRRFWIALALYGVLLALVWFTMDAGKVLVWGRPVDLRLVPVIIIGGLALRTVLARQAEKIRRSGQKE